MARQITLKAGGRNFDTGRIRSATSVKSIRIHRDGKSISAGTITEEIDIVDALGVPAIKRMTTLESNKLGEQKTMTVVAADGLRPLAYEAHLHGLDISARYQDGRVTGVRKQGKRTQIGSGLEIPRDAFDIGSIELLLRAVDLGSGWSARLNVADPMGGRVARGSLEVTGKEPVDGTSCWVVRSTVDKSAVDYWVAADGSAILRQQFSPEKGLTIEFV
jgi:hypothetical protein